MRPLELTPATGSPPNTDYAEATHRRPIDESRLGAILPAIGVCNAVTDYGGDGCVVVLLDGLAPISRGCSSISGRAICDRDSVEYRHGGISGS